MFVSFGLPSLPFPNSFVPSVLSLPPFYYLVYRYDVFLCNEESKNSIEDWLNLTCFRTFTALHWKREVSKEPFQFILERVIDAYQVLVYIKYWCTGNLYIKHSRTDQMKNSFSRIGEKIWNSIPDSDRVLPIVNINLKIPYRVIFYGYFETGGYLHVCWPAYFIDIFSKY